MTLALLIDTSQEEGFIALIQDQKVARFHSLRGSFKLSTSLLPAIQSILQDTPLETLSYIGIGVGPGSYMGIRSSAMVAKTFSFALKIPLISFCSCFAFLPIEQEGSFAFIGEAKMGELFIVKGLSTTSHLECAPPILIKPEALEQHVQGVDSVISNWTLNIERLALYTNQQFNLKNILNFSNLSLIYLR